MILISLKVVGSSRVVICKKLYAEAQSSDIFLSLLAAGIGRSEGTTKESTRAGLHVQVPLHF